MFVLFLSSSRVSEHSAACGLAPHSPASAPAEGAAHLLWNSQQHLFHN